MRIKTFSGPDLASALALAGRELGPDALVLATNEVRGRLGLTQVEVTVGIERGSATDGVELRRLAGELERLRAPAEREPEAGRRSSAVRRPPAVPQIDDRPEPLDPTLRAAVAALSRSGLGDELASRFARSATATLRRHGTRLPLGDVAERAMGELLRFAEDPSRARALFVVGPPGAGKTTTAAKLAGRLAGSGSGRRVVFAQADTERPSANEQAAAYAGRLGFGLVTVRAPGDLDGAIADAGPESIVIIDTSGVGASDGRRLARIAELRGAAPFAECALLVPAGLNREEACAVVERFEPIAPTCIGLSKVDDGLRLGELISAVAAKGLPVAFVTDGHEVPDRIAPASPRRIAALLLRSGFLASASAAAEARP